MDALKRLAELLHTLFCNSPHVEQMEEILKARVEGRCYYYLERSIVDEEEQIDTRKWMEEAQQLCKQLNASPEDAVKIVFELLEVYKQLNRLFARHPNARSLASALLQL